MNENLFVVGLNMEDKSAEEIAWDAAQKILAIMDDLYKEQQEEKYTGEKYTGEKYTGEKYTGENCTGEEEL
ncbi:MAG: hypothetical protein LUG56_07825 [Lachnospiraceae bacterium]|nr:hypothetical protein [Lachnospiraceae bacterium]